VALRYPRFANDTDRAAPGKILQRRFCGGTDAIDEGRSTEPGKTLGSQNPGVAVAAIEQLVAAQATPNELDASDVDMSDIQKLLEAIELADQSRGAS